MYPYQNKDKISAPDRLVGNIQLALLDALAGLKVPRAEGHRED
jgi:hypothetical protein